jgi:thioredoxin reductase (NADPH)
MSAEAIHGEEQHDVVIVGAGTAGVSCALECFDIQLDAVVLEADERPGGQLVEIVNSVRNVAVGTFRDGPAVRDSLEEAAAILSHRLRLSHPVTRVDLGDRWIEAGPHRIRGRALVIATGTAHQQLAGAEDGAFGGDVTSLLEARSGRFVGRDVVVIGGGDSAALDALELAREGSKVWLVHRSDALTARHDIVEQVRREKRIEQLARWELESVDGSDRLEGVTLVRRADGARRHLETGGLVVKIAVSTSIPPRRKLMAAAPTDLPSVSDVVAEFQRALRSPVPARAARQDVLGWLLELHQNNVEQWSREDAARRDAADDREVAAAKRDIDVLNTTRHELVEAIDAALAAGIEQARSAPPTTESPAMVFDRLSVLVIRIAFTESAASSQVNERDVYADRLPVLYQQLSLLREALDALLHDVQEGRKRFVPYQSLKLYRSVVDQNILKSS